MFGKLKKQKKVDSRVRYQHADFTRKLSQARGYKRTVRQQPEGKLHASLQRVGLASLLAQLLVAALLIIVAYLLYVPNPLFVRTVRIEGLSSANAAKAEEVVKQYLNNKPWYVHGNNLLFIDETQLADQVKREIPAIWHVNEQAKSYRNKTITISVTEKYERFAVIRGGDQVIVYNDGTVKSLLPKPEQLPPSGALITVVVLAPEDAVNESIQAGQTYLPNELVSFIEAAAAEFTKQMNHTFAYFELDLKGTIKIVPIPSSSVENENAEGETEEVITEEVQPAGEQVVELKPLAEIWKGAGIKAVVNKTPAPGRRPSQLRVVLEPGMDIAAAGKRLEDLLAQTEPDRYQNLYYIDLRLPNRAFLCLVNTPCAKSNP